MSSGAAPADAASESQAALDSVTAWHAKYHSIEWQRYLLEPREISFLEYYREEILHGGLVVAATAEAALLADLDFSPDKGPGDPDLAPWTSGINDLWCRMHGASSAEPFSKEEIKLVLESLLQAGGVHSDQRQVVLEGLKDASKEGLLAMVSRFVEEVTKKMNHVEFTFVTMDYMEWRFFGCYAVLPVGFVKP